MITLHVSNRASIISWVPFVGTLYFDLKHKYFAKDSASLDTLQWNTGPTVYVWVDNTHTTLGWCWVMLGSIRFQLFHSLCLSPEPGARKVKASDLGNKQFLVPFGRLKKHAHRVKLKSDKISMLVDTLSRWKEEIKKWIFDELAHAIQNHQFVST